MATYTNIPNSDLDAESPITQALMESLASNPIAISEGALGAPKIKTAAIADFNVTNAKLANASISQSKMNYILGSSGSESVTSTSGIAYKTVAVTGLIFYRHDGNGGGFNEVELYSDGVWKTVAASGMILSTGTNIRIKAYTLNDPVTVILNYTQII